MILNVTLPVYKLRNLERELVLFVEEGVPKQAGFGQQKLCDVYLAYQLVSPSSSRAQEEEPSPEECGTFHIDLQREQSQMTN